MEMYLTPVKRNLMNKEVPLFVTVARPFKKIWMSKNCFNMEEWYKLLLLVIN